MYLFDENLPKPYLVLSKAQGNGLILEAINKPFLRISMLANWPLLTFLEIHVGGLPYPILELDTESPKRKE